MAVSKRLRFEVLRRDGHACRYCGRAAPAVALTVDHVLPVALGGGDDASNLVAACTDCNAGKTSSTPDPEVVAQVAADAVRWSRAIAQAAADMEAVTAAREAQNREFDALWVAMVSDPTTDPRPGSWAEQLDRFRALGLSQPLLIDAFWTAAMAEKVPTRAVWRYFCGVCWRKLDQLREAAAAMLTTEDADGGAL